MKNLKITTAKIAEICNVSQGTVDRALHNRIGIKAETKQKILGVARQYGFRTDMQMPEKENRGQIGIIVFNLNNEYFSPALHYGNAEAPRRRYEGFLRKIGNANYTVVTNIEDIQSTYAETTTVIASSDYYALQVYFKTQNVKVVGFDNISALDKYKIDIDSLGYSMSEIARGAVDIIRRRKKESIIVAHHTVYRNEK